MCLELVPFGGLKGKPITKPKFCVLFVRREKQDTTCYPIILGLDQKLICPRIDRIWLDLLFPQQLKAMDLVSAQIGSIAVVWGSFQGGFRSIDHPTGGSFKGIPKRFIPIIIPIAASLSQIPKAELLLLIWCVSLAGHTHTHTGAFCLDVRTL